MKRVGLIRCIQKSKLDFFLLTMVVALQESHNRALLPPSWPNPLGGSRQLNPLGLLTETNRWRFALTSSDHRAREQAIR